MRKLIALLVAFVSLPAFAATVNVTWTNPVEYTDNTPLPSSAISRTRIEYGTCAAGNAFGTKAGDFISSGNDTAETSPNLAPGTYCFRAYTTASGIESAASNVSSSVVPQPAPKPPTLLQAIVAWLRSFFGRFA